MSVLSKAFEKVWMNESGTIMQEALPYVQPARMIINMTECQAVSAVLETIPFISIWTMTKISSCLLWYGHPRWVNGGMGCLGDLVLGANRTATKNKYSAGGNRASDEKSNWKEKFINISPLARSFSRRKILRSSQFAKVHTQRNSEENFLARGREHTGLWLEIATGT